MTGVLERLASRRRVEFSNPGVADAMPSVARWLLRLSPLWITVIQSVSALHELSAGQIVGVMALQLVVAAGWLWVLFGRGGWLADQLALVVAIGAGCGLHVITDVGQVYVLGYAAIYVGVFFYGLPEAAITWVAGVAAVGLCTGLVGKPDLVGGVGNALGAFFFGVAALSWGRVMRESKRNAELVEELRDSREAERLGAVAAERARLARELHDVLAHTLSGLTLHLESTRALASSRHVDADVLQRLEKGVSLARTGLKEARVAVGTLRDDELPGPERLSELVAEFAEASGIDCRYDVVGDPRPLRPEARVAVFRATQEALSNIAKHADAGRVDICLDWSGETVALRVADHRRSQPRETVLAAAELSQPGSSGNGLRGMRERAELAGGRLTAGPTPDGFALEVSLPA